jgi:hypothetical protein
VPQPTADGAQPAALGVIAEQGLRDCQADELGVAELGSPAGPLAGFQQLVDGDLQCDDEVVETGEHEASLEVDVAGATPILGDLASCVTVSHSHPDSASVI